MKFKKHVLTRLMKHESHRLSMEHDQGKVSYFARLWCHCHSLKLKRMQGSENQKRIQKLKVSTQAARTNCMDVKQDASTKHVVEKVPINREAAAVSSPPSKLLLTLKPEIVTVVAVATFAALN